MTLFLYLLCHRSLPFFQLKGLASPLSRLLWDIRCHYQSQLLKQFYVYVLGMDVLGNPYTLIQDFTNGLGDHFYEPFLVLSITYIASVIYQILFYLTML